ncbi:MAG: hypothetical protein NTV05_12635 [Acidobacteria bacterium]|nr:hypothetical protein [Acidobacteriota bacterium]
MTVDFRAVGSAGAPVLDLKPAEVSLRIGGRARDIQSLELIRLGSRQVAANGTTLAPLAPPFASNHPSDGGRNVILMLEDESIPSGREQTVKDAVDALLDNLTVRDVVSLLVISKGKFEPGPTTQHDGIRTAVGKFVSQASQSQAAADVACRTQRSLGAIQSVMASLPGGARTTIVFISGGLAPPIVTDAIVSKTFSGGAVACEIRRSAFNDISTAAYKTSADLYAVYLPPDVQGGSTAASDTGIETLAGASGNALIRLSGDSKAEMARVGRETSAYYLASFEPDAAERSGSAARVELRVTRENVKVRARSEVQIAKSAGAAAGTKALSARDMLRVATAYRDLSIRAVACPARDAGSKDLKIVVMLEPFEASLPLASAAVGLFDDKGKLVVQWTSQPTDLGARPVVAGFTVRPGTYRMRVAATDGAGRGGTVDQNLAVELEKGDGAVQMSALVFGIASGQAFAPRLIFESETGALGSFEVYGVPNTSAVTAAVEIAASASGPVVATAPARVGSPGSDGRRVALAAIPLGSLPPGDHLVRVVVSVDGKPVGRVVRTLRKVGS